MSQTSIHCKFTAIPFDGLNTDCLGNYLAAIGLLSVISRRWRNLRGCWQVGRFVLYTDDPVITIDAIKQFLLEEWKVTNYERWWTGVQKADTKAKSSSGIWRERSNLSAADVRLLDAHLVGTGRNRFNPVLGTGGNVGKRDLAKAYADAAKLLTKTESGKWLDATLLGKLDGSLPDLNNGGTWFVYANKTFNSGQSWYREGQMSPWSQLLATEGAFLLVGGVNRRLGTRTRPYAVFPFVSESSQPETDGEIGLSRAEFWGPLWKYPASLAEVRSLFERGLAKLGGRPAQAPHEFAVAAMSAGVDVGLVDFARFELRQTTSSQVYEAIPRPHIRVGESRADTDEPSPSTIASPLLVNLIESGWMDRLPFEPRDSKQRGKFVGLRGPIEASIVRLAERPADSERWQNLLLGLAGTQNRIDRNKKLRDRCIPIPLLSKEWFDNAWPHPRPIEIDLAKAIASIGWYHSDKAKPIPMQANIFGVEFISRKLQWRTSLPDTKPAQAVWGSAAPLQTLLDVAYRRLVDAVDLPRAPFAGTQRVRASLIQQFLSEPGSLDLELILKWVPPLALIDWSRSWQANPSEESQSSSKQDSWHYDTTQHGFDGTLMLHALVRPLFHVDGRLNIRLDHNSTSHLFRCDQLPKPNLLRRLFHLLRFGALDEAIQVVRDRYLAVGKSIVMPPDGLVADGERVAAAMLIPMTTRDVELGLRRWLQPTRAH